MFKLCESISKFNYYFQCFLLSVKLMSSSFVCLDETLTGLIFDVKKAIESLTTTDHSGCITSIESGCELFLHFITRSRGSIDNMVSFVRRNLVKEIQNLPVFVAVWFPSSML